jgi:hypothetical protein
MQQDNPFAPAVRPPSRLITEREFAAMHSAAAYAYANHLYLDVHLSITWRLLGIEDEGGVQVAFTRFLKCFRSWLADRKLPQAWLYSHEVGRKHGVHTHLQVHLPANGQGPAPQSHRTDFRVWVRRWARHVAGGPAPHSTYVKDDGGRLNLDRHWLNFAYLMKGYDRNAVIRSAWCSPDGMDVMLGDLIPFEWKDPGPLTMKRVGFSRSLGPARRAAGFVPATGPFIPEPDSLAFSISMKGEQATGDGGQDGVVKFKRLSFRSPYENGARFPGELYSDSFLRLVRLGPGLAKRAQEEDEREARREAEAAHAEEVMDDEELQRRLRSLEF